jgi:hypothetical protein
MLQTPTNYKRDHITRKVTHDGIYQDLFDYIWIHKIFLEELEKIRGTARPHQCRI